MTKASSPVASARGDISPLLIVASVTKLGDSTLVMVSSEFGRTPKINATAGRDHWPSCYTVVLAGGGIRGGQIIGESDKSGAVPKSRPVTPADIPATAFTALGYDPQGHTYLNAEGRPYPLSEGEAIKGLL